MSICIIGMGQMGKTHLDMVKKLSISSNIVLVDSDKEKLSDYKFLTYQDYHDAISNNANFDAIHVCLPTNLHFPVVKDLIKNSNSNILVEKPFTLNSQEANNLVSLIKNGSKRVFMCGLVERFYHPFTILRDWSKSRRNNIVEYKLLRRTKKPKRSGWFADKHKGGDVLLDLGIHDLDLLWWFSNKNINKIVSVKRNKDRVKIKAVLENNARVEMYFGWDLSDSNKDWVVNEITISTVREKAAYYSAGKKLMLGNNKHTVKTERYPDAYREEIRHFYDCIKKGKKCRIDFNEATKSMTMLSTITNYE